MKTEIFFHIRNNKFLGFLILVTLFSSCVIFLPHASASHATVNLPATDLSTGAPVVIEVSDLTAVGSGTIPVTVTTASDPVGITLILTETSPGLFDDVETVNFVPQLFLMNGDNKFPLETTLEITFTNQNVYDPNVIDVFSAVVGKVNGEFIEPTITETGPDTGIFKGRFTITGTGPSTNDRIEISPGEIFTVIPPCGDSVFGQVTPASDGVTFGAIKAKLNDIVTVTYGDSSHTDSAPVTIINSDCGGSGGGLVISRIVLDVLGGTSGGDFIPPQLVIPKISLSELPLVGDILNFIQNADPFTPITPLDDLTIDYPLSINGDGYLLTQFANTIQTYKGKTGEPVSFKMNLVDATGVKHIGLYTNLRGDHREVSDSDTYLIYNEGKPLEITDPHGLFSNVNFTESENKGKYIANFNMTFAKPMDTSDVIIRTWDELLNSGDIKVFDAIKIEGEPLVNPNTDNLIVPDSTEIIIPYYKLPHYIVPNADSEGNLVYYNSFGGVEEKKVHPYYDSIIYSDEIGKNERHEKEFSLKIIDEAARAEQISQSIIINPFTNSTKNREVFSFNLPEDVGSLDRENKELLKNLMMAEQIKASNIYNKYFITNHIRD